MTLRTSTQDLGGVSVLVEYSYEPGEAEEGPESRAAGPGCSASVVVTRVHIMNENGYGGMIGADAFNADIVADWESLILMEERE